MKFCIEVFRERLSGKHGFLENRLAASPTLLNGIKGFIPVLSTFL